MINIEKEEKIKEANTHINKMMGFDFNGMRYIGSWGSVMEVVEFIESKGACVYIKSNNCVIQSIGDKDNSFKPKTYFDIYGEDKLEAVFFAVSEFAKLYNLNNM